MRDLLLFALLFCAIVACFSMSVGKQDIHDNNGAGITAPGEAIRGYYHAWWTIIPLPTETVRQMLPGWYMNILFYFACSRTSSGRPFTRRAFFKLF